MTSDLTRFMLIKTYIDDHYHSPPLIYMTWVLCEEIDSERFQEICESIKHFDDVYDAQDNWEKHLGKYEHKISEELIPLE